MRPTAILLRHLPPLKSSFTFSSRSPAIYSLGLSYASKNSPPFIDPKEKVAPYGYAGYSGNDPGATLVSEWVKSSMERRAGRGDLTATKTGGWDDSVQDQVRGWGAGEDFFAVVDLEAAPDPSNYLASSSSSASSSTRSSLESSYDPPVHLAISDGVGGWSDVVDPSFFSQALMYHYSKSASQPDLDASTASTDGEGPSVTGKEMKRILNDAYQRVLKEESVVAGSATACGVALDSKGRLNGINLGDSGCCVIRDGKVVFETPSLTHYFNCPTQLSKIPRGMESAGVFMDQVDDKSSDTFEAQLQPRDVILLYTDGLSDNVPSSHFPLLLTHLTKLLDHPDNSHLSLPERDVELARLFADILVSYGRRAMTRTGNEIEASGAKGWITPFQAESQKAGLAFRGGKIDDITVMAAVVSELYPESD